MPLEIQYWMADEVLPALARGQKYILPPDHPVQPFLLNMEGVDKDIQSFIDNILNQHDPDTKETNHGGS